MRQDPALEPLGDNPSALTVHPVDHVGLAVLLLDHRRVVLADHSVAVQLLDGVQVGQRGLGSLVLCGVDDQGFFSAIRTPFCGGHGQPADELPATVTMVRFGVNVAEPAAEAEFGTGASRHPP